MRIRDHPVVKTVADKSRVRDPREELPGLSTVENADIDAVCRELIMSESGKVDCELFPELVETGV